MVLSGSTAVIGAVLGALLAWLIAGARPTSLLRRVVTSMCGVLAQFGGVFLAFAFIATFGFSGVVTELLRSAFDIDIFGSGWLFGIPGLVLVYTYFQIPLMVIVFLPALEGLRPQWREAAREPRCDDSGSTSGRSRSRCSAPPSSAACCCSSPTRSPPTRPRRPW